MALHALHPRQWGHEHESPYDPSFVDAMNGSIVVLRRLTGDTSAKPEVERMVSALENRNPKTLFGRNGGNAGGPQMNGGNVIYRMYDDRNAVSAGGAIGGPVDSLCPRVYIPKGHHPSDYISQMCDVGRNYFVEDVSAPNGDPIYSMGTALIVDRIPVAPEDNGMIDTSSQFVNDDVFWAAGDYRETIKVKSPAVSGPVKTLVGWPEDPSHPAGGLGTGQNSPAAVYLKLCGVRFLDNKIHD
ncbi:MAG: hypothetical protein FWD69_11345 [Polyangiaceae bacterium]|nr:hypothetical protein [Polyangiaceae bacterium]